MSGKVIKGQGMPSTTAVNDIERRRPVIAGVVYDARQEAARILAVARDRAEEIERRADEAAERTRRAGWEAGHQEGLAQVTRLLAEGQMRIGQAMERLEGEMVRLAVACTQKILGRELAADPHAVVDVVRTALNAARQQREILIRVHPADAAVLRSHRHELLDTLDRARDIELREDTEVAPGGCVITTELGTIDAQLATQLEMLERLFGEE